jgi:DnaJ domain
MQNLYDMLGVRPHDDAENLRKAYRRAAKESHPDHHGGNPEAAMRFRQITEAYDILRDAEQRAAYDQLLDFERRPLRWKLKRALSDIRRHIAYDVTAGAVLAIVLAGSYEFYAGLSEAPTDDSAGVAAVLPAGQGSAATPQMPILIPTVVVQAAPATVVPVAVAPVAVAPVAVAPVTVAPGAGAAADTGAADAKKDEPVLESASRTIPAAIHDSDPDMPVDEAVTKISTADSGKSRDAEPRDAVDVPPADVQASAAEKYDGAGNAASLAANAVSPAVTDDRRDRKRDSAGANAGDAKQLQEMRASARPPAAAKRQPASRPSFEQAALEARTVPASETRSTPACAGSPSCSGDVPPLFGVGN